MAPKVPLHRPHSPPPSFKPDPAHHPSPSPTRTGPAESAAVDPARPEGRRNASRSVSAHRATLGWRARDRSEATSSTSSASSDEPDFDLIDRELLPLSPAASRYAHLRGAELHAQYKALPVVTGLEAASEATFAHLEEAYERAKTDALEKGTLDAFLKKPVLVCGLSRHGRLEGIGTSIGAQRFAKQLAHKLAQGGEEKLSCRLELDPYSSGRLEARRQHIDDTGEIKNDLKRMASTELPRKLTTEEIAEYQDVHVQVLHGESIGIEDIRGTYRDQEEVARCSKAKAGLIQGYVDPQLKEDARLPAFLNQERGMLRAIREDIDRGRSVIVALTGPAHGPLFHSKFESECTMLMAAHLAGLPDSFFTASPYTPHIASRTSYCLLNPEIHAFKGAQDSPLTSEQFQDIARSLGLTHVPDDAKYVSSDEFDTDAYAADESSARGSDETSSVSGASSSGQYLGVGRSSGPASTHSSGSSGDSGLRYGYLPPSSHSSEGADSDLAYPSASDSDRLS